jgi:hypothetical protein
MRRRSQPLTRKGSLWTHVMLVPMDGIRRTGKARVRLRHASACSRVGLSVRRLP